MIRFSRVWRLIPVAALCLGCGAESPSPGGEYPLQNPNAVVPMTLPTTGPYYHTLRTASSADGLTWTEDRPVDLIEHASVPAAVQLHDGTLIIYFVDFSSGNPERLGCLVSDDEGSTFRWGQCAVKNLSTPKAVDFAPLLMQDGSVWLYYYSSDQSVNSTTEHIIDVAVSANGMNFTRQSTVFTHPGLVDPDIFHTGTEYIMHVFSLTDGATVRASSPDGLTFEFVDHLVPPNIGVTKPVTLDDGTFRMYGFPQGPNQQDRFLSFRSADGMSWTQETGNRLVAPAGFETTDPYVIRLKGGKWFMVYKRSKRGQ